MRELSGSDVLLLDAFSCALCSKGTQWAAMPERNVWKSIYHDAQEHKIFPMIMESVNRSSIFAADDRLRHNYLFYLKRAEAEIQTQAQRSADFLLLYDYLLQKGLKPQVMKGIICRNLYPQPEHRPSADEDLLIDEKDFPACHQAILEYGLQLVDPTEDIWNSHEVAYQDQETLLYIEVHKQMFPTGSPIFSKWNDYFGRNPENCITDQIYGFTLYTLDHTDHLLYLILHAFKHFLYGGFGIRQIADIALFSKEYAEKIDWGTIQTALCEVNAKDFTRALYKIANQYLSLELTQPLILPGWNLAEIDETGLLFDVMESGLYGASTPRRQHSSNMTLYAVENKQAKKGSHLSALLHTVFLPRKNLEKRYPYLQKVPFLLPLAWSQRIIQYVSDSKNRKKQSGGKDQLTDGIQLGKQRIELLKEYHII